MSAFQNDERFCRKSSVYNQTGQTYFQQLSAYNHMSAHLRRVLLAPCIVDSRNKRYSRSKGLSSGKCSSRSKSLEKIRTQEDIIDGVAYDTQHHPLDVLRKSLECSPECHQEVKEVGDACGRCNSWSARSSRVGVTSCTVAQKMPVNSGAGGTTCKCLHLQSCKACSTPALKRVSPKSSRLNGGCRRVRVPIIADRREWKRSASDRSRTIKSPPSRSNVKRSEASYAYSSSFESSSENSTAPGSPILKLSAINRGSRPETPSELGGREINNKNSETAEESDEAKYAKFIYDITQEITINGLYTDDDLYTIFKKHIDMNSHILDNNKMQSEIHRLKMALNVRVSSDDEEVNDIEQFSSSPKFAKYLMERKQTPTKVFDDYNFGEKMRRNETPSRFGEPRRPKSVHDKSTAHLMKPNPELLITEQDVIITLREMKLDPRQIQSICKSLQKRSREIAPSQLVKNYTETSSFKRGPIRSNSPVDSNGENRTIDVHRSYTDRKLQNASDSPRKNETWQCRCEDSPTAEQSQTKVQPEIEIQPSPSNSQGDRIHIAFTNTQLEGISEPSITPGSVRSIESRKIYEPSVNNETKVMEENISRETSFGNTKLSQESLRSLVRLVSEKSFGNENEDHEEMEKRRKAKINMRKTARAIQAENKSEDNSSVESAENENYEEHEEMSNMKMKKNTPRPKNCDRFAYDPKSLPDLKFKSDNESTNDEIVKTPKMRYFDNSSPPNEEADISFVSHSTFLTNLRKGDVTSLPDISEISEGITEEITTDENVKIIPETTSDRSHIEEVNDEKIVNFTANTCQVDVISVDNKSSEISENSDGLEVPSFTEISEGRIIEVVMSQTRGLATTEESSDQFSPSSAVKVSGDLENDEDSDENKSVVVADLKASSSSELIPNINLSSPSFDKTPTIVTKKKNLSPDLSPRISEHEDYKISDQSPINSAEKKKSDENYSLNVERRPSTSDIINKNSDKSSIETELDQQETLHSTSEIQVEEENLPSSKIHSKVEKEDEESRKLDEQLQESDRDSMKIEGISKNNFRVYRPDRDSVELKRKIHENSENSKKQKEKPQIRNTRFGRLIGRGNRQRNFKLEGTSESPGKESRIEENDKERWRPNFPDETITTASDISFLRKRNVNDSGEISIESSSDLVDHQREPRSSNSREIERYISKSRSLGNSYTSIKSKKASTSGILKPRQEIMSRRQDNINKSENSISKRMKAAVGNLIRRSSKDININGNNKNSPRNFASTTTDSRSTDGKYSPRSQVTETILTINSENSSCVCVLTTRKVQRNSRGGNCRPDCRGRSFVCDQRCSLFNRVLH